MTWRDQHFGTVMVREKFLQTETEAAIIVLRRCCTQRSQKRQSIGWKPFSTQKERSSATTRLTQLFQLAQSITMAAPIAIQLDALSPGKVD